MQNNGKHVAARLVTVIIYGREHHKLNAVQLNLIQWNDMTTVRKYVHAGRVVTGMDGDVSSSVHHIAPDWDVSSDFAWTRMKFHTSTETGSGMTTTMVSDSSEDAVDNLQQRPDITHRWWFVSKNTEVE